MTVPETPAPKRTNTVWIIIGIVVVVLICCALLAAAIVGGYFLLRINTHSGSPSQPLPLPFFSTPNPSQQEGTPPASTGPLSLEPFDPTNSNYPALPDLIPTWKGQTSPGSKDWSTTVPASQPVLIIVGWCTRTAEILQQNDAQIKWTVTVDGQNVEVSKLFAYDQTRPDGVCHSSVGLIRQWTGDTHKITTTMTVAQKINDGWTDFAAGDYTDNYTVTVGQ